MLKYSLKIKRGQQKKGKIRDVFQNSNKIKGKFKPRFGERTCNFRSEVQAALKEIRINKSPVNKILL